MSKSSRRPCPYTSLMELCPAQLPSLMVEDFAPPAQGCFAAELHTHTCTKLLVASVCERTQEGTDKGMQKQAVIWRK